MPNPSISYNPLYSFSFDILHTLIHSGIYIYGGIEEESKKEKEGTDDGIIYGGTEGKSRARERRVKVRDRRRYRGG